MAALWQNIRSHSHTTLAYDQAKDWVYVKWRGHINFEDVIAAAKKYLEFVQEHPCPKLLNDKSEVTGDWQEANDWLEYEWLPQALDSGLRYFSMVLSRDLHDLVPSHDLQRRLGPECEVKLFRELAPAQQWLEGVTP